MKDLGGLTRIINRHFTSVAAQQSPPPQADGKVPPKKLSKKLKESYQLSDDEISSILLKPKSKPQIMHPQEVNFDPNYERDIKDIIKEKLKPVEPKQEIVPQRKDHVKEVKGAASTQEEKSVKLGRQKQSGVEIFRESDRKDVKYYKYELPIPNVDPDFEGLDDVFERARKAVVTPNMELWEALAMDKMTSYEDYLMKLKENFNYGMHITQRSWAITLSSL